MCVCVCVCVCVFKVVIFWETTKEKALKDAEKFALFCPSCFCRYVNTFCFTGAKVRVFSGINKLFRHKARKARFEGTPAGTSAGIPAGDIEREKTSKERRRPPWLWEPLLSLLLFESPAAKAGLISQGFCSPGSDAAHLRRWF